MSHPIINADDCVGCGICADACPQEVIEISGGTAEVVNEESCIACGICQLRAPEIFEYDAEGIAFGI